MLEIPLPYFDQYTLFFSLNKSAKQVSDFLLEQDIPIMEVVEYVTDKTPNVNGKTTLFKDSGIILVKMDYFNNSIRYISILAHEIVHVANRIIGDCSKEEAICYVFDYIFEEIMKILNINIDYTNEPRDWSWFESVVKV